jgi:uncharacterized Zn-finger protein
MNNHYTSTIVELGADDLPVCPNKSTPLWSYHPRIVLDFKHGQARCPYCGTVYQLKPGTVFHAH